MANNLTALAPILFQAARIVPRELTGFVGASWRDFDDKGAALNDVVKTPVVPKLASASVTPSNVFATGTDITQGSRQLQLTQFEEVSWHYGAEEERSLENGGNMQEVFRQTVEQGIRTLTGNIESRAGVIASANASIAIGTAGTTPYASNLNAFADLKRQLDTNGAPQDQRSVVYGLDAAMNIRNLLTAGFLVGAEARGDVEAGSILRLHGINTRESAYIASHTKGTGASYVLNGAAVAGQTTITIDTGTGTILAGDVVTIGGVNYVVKTALAGGEIVIQDPGLRAAVADGATVTVVDSHAANIALHRNGLSIVARPALQPVGGGVEQMVISDPQTGFAFLMLRVVQNAQVSYFMRVVYDVWAPNPEYIIKHMG